MTGLSQLDPLREIRYRCDRANMIVTITQLNRLGKKGIIIDGANVNCDDNRYDQFLST